MRKFLACADHPLRLVIGYVYLIGLILFFNLFGVFYNPEVFEPWFLNSKLT